MIKIQNIYYMLSYAYKVLRGQEYVSCGTEEFDNTADLLSAILVKGISSQVKRGLEREYIENTEPISSLRGRMDITQSIKEQTLIKQQLMCTYDEFSIDSYFNKIIKTTVNLLLHCDISKARKKELRNLMIYFKDVGILDYHLIDWNIRYNRNNQTYRMLISVCYLIIKGLLQTDNKGNVKMQKFIDEQHMCRLYEKFILEYYKKEFPQFKVAASQIPWNLDNSINVAMLPIMQSDIMISYNEKILIIDAKYYLHTTQKQYDVYTVHSNNLYQIYTYVKNKDINHTGNVSGMLLYARTDETIQPNNEFKIDGNKISVQTLDLNSNFSNIKLQLNQIINRYFYVENE